MSTIAIHPSFALTFSVHAAPAPSSRKVNQIRRGEDPIFKNVLAASTRAFASVFGTSDDWDKSILQEADWEGEDDS